MSEIYDITIVEADQLVCCCFMAICAKLKSNWLIPLRRATSHSLSRKKYPRCTQFTNLTGEEIEQPLDRRQVKRFDTRSSSVEDIQRRVTSSLSTSRQVHQSKAVIIAMGGGAFKPRALDIEGWTLITSTTVTNIQQYEGQQVTVLGGGDSAMDWALDKIAPTTIVHRRDNFVPWNIVIEKNSNVFCQHQDTICS